MRAARVWGRLVLVTRDSDEFFLGRDDEQDRLRAVLSQVLAADQGPDEGYLVLVHGLGGIGKSTLLEHYRRIVTGDLAADRVFAEKFLLVDVDWEEHRLRNPAWYPPEGPLLWRVLDILYEALTKSARGERKASRCAERAFRRFRERAAQAADSHLRLESGTGPALGKAQMALGALAGAATLLGPQAKVVAEGVKQLTSGITGALEAKLSVRSGRLDYDQFEALVRPDDALVRSFIAGLREVSTKVRPIVLSVDTAEILGDALVPLFQVIEGSGSRAVWLVGVRLVPEEQAAAGSVAALYLQRMRSARLRSVVPGRFSSADVAEYLLYSLGDPLPTGVTADAVTSLTRGIPLAVRLAVELLKTGLNPEEALAAITSGGEVSKVVSGLAQRYLIHVTGSGRAAVDPDLDRILGLALLESAHDDPELLGALWQVPPAEVADMKTLLSRRHDFVLNGEPSLHQEVRDTIRLFLLNWDQRVRVRPANERAQEVLRQRLTELHLMGVEAQLGSDQWCATAGTLLWHTIWASDRAGLELLVHLLPAAALVRPEFARQLLGTAEHFSPVFPRELEVVAAGLQVLMPGSIFLRRLRTHFEAAKGNYTPVARSRLHAAVKALESGRAYPRPVLADDLSATLLLDLFKVRYAESFELGLKTRAGLITDIAAQLTASHAESAEISIVIGTCAEELATALGRSDETLRDALKTAQLAARYSPLRIQSWETLGLTHQRLKQFEESLAAYAEAVRLSPDSAASHHGQGYALGRLGRFEESLAAYERALELEPGSADRHHRKGVALECLGRFEESLAAYAEAVRLSPDIAASHHGQGYALVRLGRDDEMLAAYEQALDLEPGSAARHHSKGVALGRLGRFEESLAAYERALELEPGSADRHHNKGVALERLGRFDEMLAAYERALELEPGSADRHHRKGVALECLGRFEESLAAYAEAVRLSPDSAASHHGQGYALGRLGRFEESLAAYERALELEPGSAARHHSKGVALGRLGRFEESLAAYERALELE